MYCVKCGVKLQNGVTECPLCHTPVMIKENIECLQQNYSSLYPKEKSHEKYTALGITTAFMFAIALVCLIVCLKLYRSVNWSGYVMLGLALVYISVILPLWFEHYYQYIFLPLTCAGLEGYVLYICLYNHGQWFMSFAFPLILIIFGLIIGAFTLYHYLKKGHIFITGGLLIAIGNFCMLIEFFEVLTFKTTMWSWSLYAVTIFSALGLFLIIAGCIPPLRAFIERKLFI